MIHGLGALFGMDNTYFWYGDNATAPAWFGRQEPIQLLPKAHPDIFRRTRVLGTTDQSQVVLDRIAARLDVPSVTLGRYNVGRPEYSELHLSPSVVRKIADLNQEDRKLFDFVATAHT